jgi:catechol 2,3-dioxygenase-like lactoylglutathione lyase family enzyme
MVGDRGSIGTQVHQRSKGDAMSVALNHTILHARDKQRTAQFLSDILGLPPAARFGPFLVVSFANDVSLDVAEDGGPIEPQHYAFLVTEEEFDQIFERITARGLPYWADPFHHQPNRINTNDGGRGLYWSDPDGHNLEIITRPYGG